MPDDRSPVAPSAVPVPKRALDLAKDAEPATRAANAAMAARLPFGDHQDHEDVRRGPPSRTA